MALQVIKVDTDSRRDVNRFIELQFTLYRDCRPWVPPLIDDMKMQLNRRKYPYYEHSEADFFIAEREGRPVGRIAALNNTRYNDYNKSHTAFFYFYDVENDPEASQALFGAVEDWARVRKLDKLVGAKGFLQADGLGILVDGFENRPAMGIPYNFPYYAALIEGAGYTRAARLLLDLYPRPDRPTAAHGGDCREDDAAARLHDPALRQQERAARHDPRDRRDV